MRKRSGAAEKAASFVILEEIRKVIDIEIEGLESVRRQLGPEFEQAVTTIATDG